MPRTNVLLINPTINPKTQKNILTDVIRISFPMSLGHLAGYLSHNSNINAEVYDDQITPLDYASLSNLINSMATPRIVGITTLTATCSRAYDLARQIKKIDPQALVVLGGIHASVLPEEALANESVDLVVRGEGEITFDYLVKRVLDNQNWQDLEGISYRHQGNVISNPPRPLIKDLNLLPPFPYHLFEHNRDKYSGFFSLQSSRGCPYACIFCSQRSLTGRSYRYVSTERVLADIDTLITRYNADIIRIMDDNIGANKKRLLDLLDGIIAKGYHHKVSFEAPMRGDNLDEEIATRLRDSNFSMVSFGLETASARLMETINKGETVEQVVMAIELAAAKGIPTATTLIFGLPTETLSDRIQAIKLVSKLPLDSVRFNILTPYPGTPVYNELIKQGQITVKEDWHNFSVQYMWEGDDIPYVPENTDKYELMFTTMFANLYFYLRPSGIIKMLTSRFAGGNVVVLPKKWYLSKYILRIGRVGVFLTWRFTQVLGKMLYHKLTAPIARLFSKTSSPYRRDRQD